MRRICEEPPTLPSGRLGIAKLPEYRSCNKVIDRLSWTSALELLVWVTAVIRLANP